MALKILQSGINPLGQFDCLDTELASFKGGEVCTLTAVAYRLPGSNTSGFDANVADVEDGYSGGTSKTRPAVTLTLVSGHRPLFLADDGTKGYGTLFGQVIGATGGQTFSGTNLGPHTALASGKMTIWDKEGLYAVSLDAVDTAVATGLVPTNTGITCGDPLFATTAGLLTPNTGNRFENVTVARFVEFATEGSLVTTGSGAVGTGVIAAPGGFSAFTRAVFHYQVGV
jgi:hypothetical protein